MVEEDKHMIPPVTTANTKEEGQYELKEVENVPPISQPLTFDEEEIEPEFHARTWIALAAFFLLNFTQVVALQGPSAVVSSS